MGRRRRDRYWGAAAIRARLFPWRRDSQARTPSSRPQRAPFCLAASVQARWVGRDWPLPRRPSRPQALSCHCRTCLGTMIRIGRAFAMKFAFEGLDARLHALQFIDQLLVRGLRNRLSLRRRVVCNRAASGRGQKGSHGQRGGQTAVSLSREGIEIDRANPRGKNATAFVTLLACRLLFALHRQPPFFSIEC
jgi:hypothetical protein